MSDITMNTIKLMEMLPTSEQQFALELIKKLVLAWDPDFTKLTDEESQSLENAKSSGYTNSSDIDWENLDKLNLT